MDFSSSLDIQPGASPTTTRRPSAYPGILAALYVALFLAGLFFVSGFVTNPSYPSPNTGTADIVAYFQLHPDLVRVNVFLSFGAALILGIFVITMARQLRGLASMYTDIMLFAGIATACDQIGSHSIEWALTWPGIGNDATLTQALFLYLLRLWGAWLLVAHGAFCGQCRSGCWLQKALAKMGHLVWSRSWGHRAAELAQPRPPCDISPAGPHPTHQISSVCLAHHHRVYAAWITGTPKGNIGA